MTTTVERRCMWIPLTEDDDGDKVPDDKVVTHLQLNWDDLVAVLKKSDLLDILPDQDVYRITSFDGGINLTLVMESDK